MSLLTRSTQTNTFFPAIYRKRPRCLDAFCGAGGAGMGYHRAGFEVVGVDIKPQKNYPFKFHQGDALDFIAKYGHLFDLIHTSPPCQVYSVTAHLSTKTHPDLVPATREVLRATAKPYIIENVVGSPLIEPLVLCGTMFNLRVLRHRLFEIKPNVVLPPGPCQHRGKTAPIMWGDQKRNGVASVSKLDKYQYISVCGSNFIKSDAQIAMDIDWMTSYEMTQAIPPHYTEHIGRELLKKGIFK